MTYKCEAVIFSRSAFGSETSQSERISSIGIVKRSLRGNLTVKGEKFTEKISEVNDDIVTFQ